MILVTGAAEGHQGATGNHLVKILCAQKIPVRAFVHREDERSQRLREMGAEVVCGDLLDIESVRAGLTDVTKIFFCYPVKPGLREATANMIEALKGHRLELLINLSQGLAEANAPTEVSQAHWDSERSLERAGLPAFHLRAGIYFENLFLQFAEDIKNNEIRAPFGDASGKLPLLAAKDVAKVAFAALQKPEAFRDRTIPVFSTYVSLGEIIAQVAKILERELTYKEITREEWFRAAEFRSPENTAKIQLDHLAKVWEIFKNQSSMLGMSAFPDFVEQLTGAPGETLEAWLKSDAAVRVL